MRVATRRLVTAAAVSTVLLTGTGGSALAAAPLPNAVVVPAPDALTVAAPPASRLGLTGRAMAGIVPGDRHTGYPAVACTPFNDGEEVTTLVVVLGPVPIATFMNWICDGATRTWKRR